MWFMEKMGNISGAVDGLVQKIVREDLGHDDISWSNVEQVFNPYMSGVSTMVQQRERLVSAGMSVKLAETLQRDYLNSVAE